jgi:hypothetical protein
MVVSVPASLIEQGGWFMQAAVKVVAAWHFTVSLRRGESVETGANRQLLAVQYSLSVSR